MELDKKVITMIQENDQEGINQLIDAYRPFIISITSEVLGRYLAVENDEEYSIALEAFYEAMKRYELGKSHFLPFAKLVIHSRLSNYRSKTDQKQVIALDEQQVQAAQMVDAGLRDEIAAFEEVLNGFGLDFESLTQKAPKHKDTRERANHIARETSRVKLFVDHIYAKRRLPIVKMAERFFVSIKIIKRCKQYILASVLIWTEKFYCLQEWLKPKRSQNP